ncbi:hypothetical protein LIER_29053 [Lithospermum erythrorhizon]|uniref:Uncharacterized protein n=1 Tax=Lithospermum erythrorhizon TaxID=34254 RepID=A0AAV3RNU5_LITER
MGLSSLWKERYIRPYCYKLYGRSIHQHGPIPHVPDSKCIPHIQNSEIAHRKEWRIKSANSGIAQQWKIKNDYRGNSCVAKHKMWRIKRDLRKGKAEANVVSVPDVHVHDELDMGGANGQAEGSASVKHSYDANELKNSSFVVRWIDFLRQKREEM